MNKFFLLPLVCLLVAINAVPVSAQTGSHHYKGAEAAAIYKGASQVFVNEKRNTVSFIRLQDNEFIAATKAKDWLKNEVLKLPSTSDLEQYQQFNDKAGFTHTRFREKYKGVPVEYGVYYVHAKDGRVASANGEWYNNISIATIPSINPAQAYQSACNSMNAKSWWHEREDANNNQLMVLPVDGSFKLVYKCDVYAKDPWKRAWIYVDAQNASIVKTESRIHETDVPGTAVTAYSGTKPIVSDSFATNTFRLREYTRGAGVETFNVSEGNDFTGNSKDWDYNGGFDIYALDAHFGAEATYDYYNDNYGWKSVDGAGTQKLKSLVHTGPGINAFWDGTYMSYLDGDASSGVTPLTSLEVCGHELTHGVTEHSSGLVYSCEPGGMNESLSDIFGVTIRKVNDANSTWYLGDQFNYIIRNMANPNEYGNPDCYEGLYWSNCPEVHSGSGVGNFWYYLLTDGGEGVNDVGNGYFVDGLGIVDAAAIAFRANTVYLTPNSEYADFRDLSLQSAQDLFGDCSNQSVQTVNAWYAVNVGGPFEDAVTAIFSTPQTSFCTVSSAVAFTSNSLNATSYVWDFGDGTGSTEQNPTHTYSATGIYTVTLIVNGVALCNTTDTLVKPDYITIDNVGQPVSAACTPATVTPSNNYGVFQVHLNDIDNSSIGSIEGYKDNSCSDFTHLVAGDPVILSVNTGPGKSEDLRVWIDYNGDGSFNSSDELIYQDDAVQDVHTGIIYTPTTAVLNTPLRMRVLDDKSSYDITNACYAPQLGQAEDYSVIFEPSSAAPIADFIANTTSVNFGGSVNYFDLSTNVPTSWEWQFEGGSPATSTSQNPTGIVYNTVGVYDVTLKVTNSFGTQTMTKPDYITVNSAFNMCELTTVTLDSGTFYDSGGPTGNYQNNENCSLLIAPSCAGSITLSISSFGSQSNSDFLKVYDGTDASAPLLFSLSGFPFPLPTVTGSSGSLFVTWTSSASQTNMGYVATYTSVIGGTVTPVTSFTVSDDNPALGGTVDFTDQSTNLPIHWNWNFGDGGTSTLKNPSHTYTTSGTYEVKLVSSNCGGADSSYSTVIVQAAPIIKVTPSSLTVNLSCNTTSVTVPFTISNQGGGDLVYGLTETEYNFQGDHPNILALTYGADLFESYANTKNAINQYYPDNTITEINTTNAEDLAAALQGKNVCLITKAIGDAPDYLNFAVPLQNFVNNGGTVILCGTSSTKVSCLTNTGLIEATYGAVATNELLDVVNPAHPIMQSIGDVIYKGPKNSHGLNVTSPMQKLVDYSGYTVAGYEDVGAGHVVYLGFDYKTVNDTSGKVIGNTMSWINSMLIGDFITLDPSVGGTLGTGESQVVNVTVDGTGLPNGTYTEYFIVNSNDPTNPVDTVVCTVIIDIGNCSSFNAYQGCDGSVCFTDSVPAGTTSINWTFGDGGTDSSNDPCHTYSTTGSYEVQLITCGTDGCDTVHQTIDVTILAASVAYSPTVVYEDQVVSFNSNSSGATSWDWAFGDGGTSTEENPTHTYLSPGVYTVTLTVKDAAACEVISSEGITILEVGIDDPAYVANLNIFPNPFNSQAEITYTLPTASSVNIELWNELGQKVRVLLPATNQKAGTYNYPVSIDEAGVYVVRFSAGDYLVWKKIVKVK